MSKYEQTLSIIKPDNVERNLEMQIDNQFLKNFQIMVKKQKTYAKIRRKQLNFIKFI